VQRIALTFSLRLALEALRLITISFVCELDCIFADVLCRQASDDECFVLQGEPLRCPTIPGVVEIVKEVNVR
jgi:hypothetical protein